MVLRQHPEQRQGYESAVAYAIAQELGYTKAEVVWAKVPFNNVITPGPKAFDLDLNQVSISEDRRKAVDFSSGYYDVTQVVITYKGSPIDGKTTVADLKNAKLGAQVGTTSYTALKDQIKPSKDPSVFDTNDLAVQALKSHQVDGIVVDLPTAFYMTAAQMDDKGAIVGQLPAADKPEQFGAVLPKVLPHRVRHQGGRRAALEGHPDPARRRVAVQAGRAEAVVTRRVRPAVVVGSRR